jgi:hypothetical protein
VPKHCVGATQRFEASEAETSAFVLDRQPPYTERGREARQIDERRRCIARPARDLCTRRGAVIGVQYGVLGFAIGPLRVSSRVGSPVGNHASSVALNAPQRRSMTASTLKSRPVLFAHAWLKTKRSRN